MSTIEAPARDPILRSLHFTWSVDVDADTITLRRFDPDTSTTVVIAHLLSSGNGHWKLECQEMERRAGIKHDWASEIYKLLRGLINNPKIPYVRCQPDDLQRVVEATVLEGIVTQAHEYRKLQYYLNRPKGRNVQLETFIKGLERPA